MDMLILLVERAGTLVERSEIKTRLWGTGVFVEARAHSIEADDAILQGFGPTPHQVTASRHPWTPARRR